MLKLSDVRKDYKVASEYVRALKGVSLEFRSSEFVCILGQSGCGKTTLLNIIGGLDHYTSGDLVIQGKSTKDFSDRDWDVYRNHRIGFIFQSYNLIPHQTVLGNVELALTIAGVSREERKKRAEDALRRVGLGDHLNKRPNQLSGGQMQRVAIARALVNNPDILLADEPTGALDSETSVEVMELIKEIAAERLVIMVTHNPELAELYASRIVRLKDGLVESDSNPYTETEKAAPAEAAEGGKHKKLRARMSFFTSLALSARNLLTKKGRTAVTSVAGSIGIISVCLVLALSSGFNNYIMRTEEDMLSYYPVKVTESTFDMAAVMTSFTAPSQMPDMSQVGDQVYVDSFLTGLANGMAVKNNITPEYLDYIEKMDSAWYAEIQYGYGAGLTDNLFTAVKTGNVVLEDKEVPAETRIMSLSSLKTFYINELKLYAPQYGNLVGMADFFGNIVNKMPGTADYADEGFGEYVLSQYDIIGENAHFPENDNEAVLVISSDGAATDLTLAQLGLLEESKFLSLFDKGKDDATEEEREPLFIPYEEILGKEYTLFYNDAVYQKNENYISPAFTPSVSPFTYTGTRESISAADGEGLNLKVTAILRLKEGLTYGCLSNGLNITESTVNTYLQRNMESEIVNWVKNDSKMTLPTADGGATVVYVSPSPQLDDYYYSLAQLVTDGTEIPATFSSLRITSDPESAIRHLGGDDSVNSVYFYATDFDGKENMLAYLDAWNTNCEQYELDKAAFIKAYEQEHAAEKQSNAAAYALAFEQAKEEHEAEWGYKYVYTVDGVEYTVTLKESDKITYTDQVGLLMGMMQTMLNVITYVLVAFTAISLVVSSVMIGIITYVSVVERVKEIGVLRSLGARKQDIRNLFNAETFIIGLTAGVFGVAVTYLLSIAVNAIILSLTGIAGIAALPILTALIMIAVSVGLTLISGLIPASAAAKKDPVIALRTE